jgi:HEPN domain-containing protein
MNALTAEWVAKAEGDWTTAGRELRARRLPNYDAACFHAQQTAEKYLKAFLQEQTSDVPRPHNLVELLELCRNRGRADLRC